MKSFTESLNEAASGDKEAYQAFFKKALKKFGVDEPDQLSGDKKKEFFDYVDKNWKADNETDVDEAANPFELYGSVKGWEKASKDLEKALEKAKKMSDKKKAREYMFTVQKKHKKFGATDTEPNTYIRQELGMNEEVELEEGFDVPNIDYSNLADYKGFQNLNIKKVIKKHNMAKFNVKTVQDVIVWLNMVAMQWKAGMLKEGAEIEEAKLTWKKAKSVEDKASLLSDLDFGDSKGKKAGVAMMVKEFGRNWEKDLMDGRIDDDDIERMFKKIYPKMKNETIEEAVAVDMRTKGYKEAVKRALLRKEKKNCHHDMKKKKKDTYEVKNDDVLENDGVSSKPKKEDVTTANVATTPKPLSTMRRKKKKDY